MLLYLRRLATQDPYTYAYDYTQLNIFGFRQGLVSLQHLKSDAILKGLGPTQQPLLSSLPVVESKNC